MGQHPFVVVVVQINQKTPDAPKKLPSSRSTRGRSAASAVMAVEYPLYELITHDLLQALPILKRPGIPEASFHCLASYFIPARPKRRLWPM